MDTVPFSLVHSAQKISAVWEQYLQTILKQFVQLIPRQYLHQRRRMGSWNRRAWLPGMGGTSSLQVLESRTRLPHAQEGIKLLESNFIRLI